MNLKIHAKLPGSDFCLSSRLNLLPFAALLNKLFSKPVHVQLETSLTLTLKQAYEQHLFAQGWLPAILPVSASQIRVQCNAQMGCSQGEFSFAPRDWPAFNARLRSEPLPQAPFVNWEQSLKKMREDGHTLWYYPASGRHWVFFCKDERYCEFVMWMCEDRVA